MSHLEPHEHAILNDMLDRYLERDMPLYRNTDHGTWFRDHARHKSENARAQALIDKITGHCHIP